MATCVIGEQQSSVVSVCVCPSGGIISFARSPAHSPHLQVSGVSESRLSDQADVMFLLMFAGDVGNCSLSHSLCLARVAARTSDRHHQGATIELTPA